MIEHNATVIRVADSYAWLQADQGGGGCSSCEQGAGCGFGRLWSYFSKRSPLIQIETEINLKEGDQVIVGISEGAFIFSSFLIYFLPLLLIIFFAIMGKLLNPMFGLNSEILQIGGAIIGLIVSIFLIRRYGQKAKIIQRSHPIIIKRL